MQRTFTLVALVAATAIALSAETPTRANMAPPVREFHVGLSLDRTGDGLRVSAVAPGGSAARSQVRVGDVVLAIDGRYWKVFTREDLNSFLDDVHTWPVSLIDLRTDGETVETVLLEP